MTVHLFRFRSSSQGTFGVLVFGLDWCYTGELPWRNNAHNISCIPAGKYRCVERMSPKFGRCFHLQDVPGRSYILFHAGNFCGDKTKGLRSHTYGCIILGMKIGTLLGQEAVLASRNARTFFETKMAWEPFTLEIHDVGVTH